MCEAIFCPCPPPGPRHKQSRRPAWRLGGESASVCPRLIVSFSCSLNCRSPPTHTHTLTHDCVTLVATSHLCAHCGHTHSRSLQPLRVRLQCIVHPGSRWSTVVCVCVCPHLLEQCPHTRHTQARTHMCKFLCISLSPTNAFPHTPMTTEPPRSLQSTIAQAVRGSKVCYSSEATS